MYVKSGKCSALSATRGRRHTSVRLLTFFSSHLIKRKLSVTNLKGPTSWIEKRQNGVKQVKYEYCIKIRLSQ